MHTRTLGQGLEVSAIGLGAMGMSMSYGPNPGDRDDMIGVLRYAVDQGVTFIDRIEAAGYMRGAHSWIVGENLVWGSGPLSTPQSLVTAWMNSPPHRENLLRGRFNQIGIAAVAGTPENANDATGVTVSSEYGYRSFSSKKGRASKAKARKSKARKLRKHR